jgi:hypothetical protein
MSQRSESHDKELSLILQVFGTPQGKELLKLWTQYHVLSPLSDANPTIMAVRVGRAEFVTTILNCLEGG